MKPLFKWTGGKGRLLSKYTDANFFPDASQFDVFVDLFCGSGATFLWVAERYPDKKLIINDLNTELITMYLQSIINRMVFLITFFLPPSFFCKFII